jgi:hypothetical protein
MHQHRSVCQLWEALTVEHEVVDAEIDEWLLLLKQLLGRTDKVLTELEERSISHDLRNVLLGWRARAAATLGAPHRPRIASDFLVGPLELLLIAAVILGAG